jgi:hypothetical protein
VQIHTVGYILPKKYFCHDDPSGQPEGVNEKAGYAVEQIREMLVRTSKRLPHKWQGQVHVWDLPMPEL